MEISSYWNCIIEKSYRYVVYLISNNKFSVNTPFGNGNSFLLYYLTDINQLNFDKIKYIIEIKKGRAEMPISNKMNVFHFSAYFNFNKYIFRFISSKEIKN